MIAKRKIAIFTSTKAFGLSEIAILFIGNRDLPHSDRVRPFGERDFPFDERVRPFGNRVRPFGKRLPDLREGACRAGTESVIYANQASKIGELKSFLHIRHLVSLRNAVILTAMNASVHNSFDKIQ